MKPACNTAGLTIRRTGDYAVSWLVFEERGRARGLSTQTIAGECLIYSSSIFADLATDFHCSRSFTT